MEKLFKPEQFTPTSCYTAQDKADFANWFVSFCKAGFPEKMFTERFYDMLRNCFHHIAHFNRMGFYGEWFSDEGKKLAFLKHTAECQLYGSDPEYTFIDVERVLQQWVRESGLIEVYERKVNSLKREKELHALKVLIDRYPLEAKEMLRKLENPEGEVW